MILSKLIFKRTGWRQKLILNAILIAIGISLTSNIYALDITLAAGYYEPDDGIVKDLFKTTLVYSVKLNSQYYETFDWIVSYSNQYMESRVSDLETELKVDILSFGFEKRLVEKGDKHFAKPFIGLGICGIRLEEVLEAESSGSKSDVEISYVSGSYWEIGLLGQIFSESWIEFKLTEQKVERNVFGNVHIGGRIIYLGFRTSL